MHWPGPSETPAWHPCWMTGSISWNVINSQTNPKLFSLLYTRLSCHVLALKGQSCVYPKQRSENVMVSQICPHICRMNINRRNHKDKQPPYVLGHSARISSVAHSRHDCSPIPGRLRDACISLTD